MTKSLHSGIYLCSSSASTTSQLSTQLMAIFGQVNGRSQDLVFVEISLTITICHFPVQPPTPASYLYIALAHVADKPFVWLSSLISSRRVDLPVAAGRSGFGRFDSEIDVYIALPDLLRWRGRAVHPSRSMTVASKRLISPIKPATSRFWLFIDFTRRAVYSITPYALPRYDRTW